MKALKKRGAALPFYFLSLADAVYTNTTISPSQSTEMSYKMTNLSFTLNMLKENQTLKITPIGSSMCPFFYGGRDDVYLQRPKFPLKRGDIALFQREDGTHVLHRVHHIKHASGVCLYYMLGDNQTWLEGPVKESQILAKAVKILRKGKLIDCQKNYLYRIVASAWLVLRPVRPVFIHLWNKLR